MLDFFSPNTNKTQSALTDAGRRGASLVSGAFPFRVFFADGHVFAIPTKTVHYPIKFFYVIYFLMIEPSRKPKPADFCKCTICVFKSEFFFRSTELCFCLEKLFLEFFKNPHKKNL